jgi:hypothetical protein
MWNEYKAPAEPEIDLWKENFHFYMIPADLKTANYLYWDQFWSSFSLYASILDMSPHIIGTLDFWSEIPFQKCEEQEWAQNLPETDKSKKSILGYGICLNPLKIFKSKLAQFKETLPIRGGNIVGSQRVILDIYHCLQGRAIATPGVPSTCDTQWSDSGIGMFIYEKTVNVKYFEHPVGNAHARIDAFIPAKTLRFEADLAIK